MNYRLHRLFLCATTLALTVMMSGCGIKKPSYNKQHFVLDVSREHEQLKADSQIILNVRRFNVDRVFDSKGLVYRKGKFKYESDFYNEFLIPPGVMIAEKTRAWLSQSGIFAEVLNPGSQIEPTHTLEGNIVALYGDFRKEDSPAAVMELRVFLIAHNATEESVLLGESYQASCPLNSQNTEGLVEAFNRCLEEILVILENDLQKTIANEID